MAKHLTQDDVKVIVDLLDGWQGKLTWAYLVKVYEERTGHKTTRQTLSSHEQIATAYKTLKSGDSNRKTRSPSLQVADARIDRLMTENQRLKKQVERYEAKFHRWLYNASKKNISIDELNSELPAIDRDRTDGE